MECISVFDMLKIGVGPSSSHTLGPWRAAEQFIKALQKRRAFKSVRKLKVEAYGSLALTGVGHATDIAIMMGLTGADPVTVAIESIDGIIQGIKDQKMIRLNQTLEVPFNPSEDIVFVREFLPFHANGMIFIATLENGKEIKETYYSIGGGFVVQEEMANSKRKKETFKSFPHPIKNGTELLATCKAEKKSISEIVLENERSLRSDAEIDKGLEHIWDTMLSSMYIGCHTEGHLPGGLKVRRRAYDSHKKLKGDLPYSTPEEWIETIRKTKVRFRSIFTWVSCFAL
ncbi:MAG: serine dehydratase beta chain, partial [Arenibacter sp.]|nr:serine dehydratase beta chain [Arenibacter sp.]